MQSSFFKFTLVLSSVLFLEHLGFKFLLGISEAFVCRMPALKVKVVFLLVAIQLLMLFAGALTYLEPELFVLIRFCNSISLLTKTIIVFIMNIYV
jgi:hypothetical protein